MLSEKVVDTTKVLGEKIEKMEIKDKIITTGQKTIGAVKDFGGVVVSKGKDVYVFF